MGEHFYYLHTNGDLIHKRYRPDESDFVRRIWECNLSDRGSAWTIVAEALALGANRKRIDELAALWRLTDEDAQEFASRVGIRLFLDGNAWCATRLDFIDLQASPAGFGSSCIEAIAGLLAESGDTIAEVQGASFHGRKGVAP